MRNREESDEGEHEEVVEWNEARDEEGVQEPVADEEWAVDCPEVEALNLK